MLITNYRYNMNLCGHYHSGDTNPLHFIRPHTMRGYFAPAQSSNVIEQVKRDSFPTGTSVPYSIVIGDKGSLLSSTTLVNGAASVSASAANGINILSSISGTSSLGSNLSIVASLNATINGLGTVTAALVGSIAMEAALNGTSNVSAQLNLISNMVATMVGSGTISTASLNGKLSMEADIFVNQSEATVIQIVEAVWNALAADYNTSGTMGAKLNSAGSSGDPWSTILPGGYTGDEAGALLLAYLKKIKAISSANL